MKGLDVAFGMTWRDTYVEAIFLLVWNPDVSKVES